MCAHRNASTSANPVVVVGRGPSPRPGGLHRFSIPWLLGCLLSSGPRPFEDVLTMKCAPWVLRETCSPHLISLLVHASWVSLVKKPRIRRMSTLFSLDAVYEGLCASE